MAADPSLFVLLMSTELPGGVATSVMHIGLTRKCITDRVAAMDGLTAHGTDHWSNGAVHYRLVEIGLLSPALTRRLKDTSPL